MRRAKKSVCNSFPVGAEARLRHSLPPGFSAGLRATVIHYSFAAGRYQLRAEDGREFWADGYDLEPTGGQEVLGL